MDPLTDGDGPAWMQTVIAAGIFVGTVIAGYRGYMKKFAEPKGHGGDVIDLHALADLAALTRDALTLAQRDHDMLDRICSGVERLCDCNQRLLDEVRTNKRGL